MARPPDADSAETYERILAAARDEVRATVPRNGISMRRVVERAEVSLRTLQYYFDNKAGLLEACLDGYYERLGALGAELLARVGDHGDVDTLIADAVRAFYRFVQTEQALIELRLLTNALRGELHPQRQDQFMGQIIGAAAKALSPQVALDETELRLSIQSLVSLLIRMALLSEGERESLTGVTGPDAEAAVQAHVVAAALRLLHPASRP